MLLDVSDKKAYSLPFHCLLDKYAVAVPYERVSFALFKSLKTGPMENFFLKCTAMSKKAQRLLPSSPPISIYCVQNPITLKACSKLFQDAIWWLFYNPSSDVKQQQPGGIQQCGNPSDSMITIYTQ